MNAVTDKPKFPRALAQRVADDLCAVLSPLCDRIVVAGSLRRGKATVGDVEILYIGRTETRPDCADMFGSIEVNLADEAISGLEKAGVIERRRNVAGSEMYGPKNKLVRHCETGLPVDLFATTAPCWWNYLVCRTGPADSNMRICMAAQRQGWKWNPYGPGFSQGDEIREMTSEEDVFAFVGLPCLPPSERI